MDLHTLATALKNNISANGLSLTKEILPQSELDVITTSFSLAEKAVFTLSGISADDIPDAPDTTIILNAGKVSVLGLSDLEAQVTFSVSDNKTQILIQVGLPQSWSFEQSFPQLNFSPFNQLGLAKAYFIYTSQAQKNYIPWVDTPDKTIDIFKGFNFSSHVNLDNFSSVLSLLSSNTREWIISGAFTPSATAKLPVTHLEAVLSNGEIAVGIAPIALSVTGLNLVTTIEEPQDGIQNTSFILGAQSSLGLDVNIQVPAVGSALTLDALPAENTIFTVEKIIQLPACENFQHVIPEPLQSVFSNVGLQHFTLVLQTDVTSVSYVELEMTTVSPWELIPNRLTLKNLQLTISTYTPGTAASVTSVSVSASASLLPTIFKGEFDFSIDIQKDPSASWKINTIHGQYLGSVSLGDMVHGVLGQVIKVPDGLQAVHFSDFNVLVNHSDSSYQLSGNADATIPLLGKTIFASLNSNIHHTASSDTVFVNGSMRIAEQRFRLNIHFSKDPQHQNVVLTAFWETENNEGVGLDDIALALGLHLPEIPAEFDLGLQHVGISYDYSSETLFIEAMSVNYGSIILAALKGDTNNQWDINFGYSLVGNATFSSFPVIARALTPEQDTLLNTLQKALDDEQHAIEQESPEKAGGDHNTVIHLTDIVSWMLKKFGGELPSQVPEVNLHKLSVAYASVSKEFAFTGDTTTTIEIPFLSGDHAHIHASVNLDSTINSATGKYQLSGFMEGDFTIGSSVFTLQYALAKTSHLFEASWASTSSSDLLGINTFIEAMGISSMPTIPEGMDLNLSKVYLSYQAERKTLQLVADSASYGQVFLIVSQLPIGQPHPDEDIPALGTDKWEFVFGWDYPTVSRFDKVPVIGKYFADAKIFHLTSIGLLVSSADIKKFTIPNLPELKSLVSGVPPASNSDSSNGVNPVAQGEVIPLSRGAAFIAIMDLGASSQKGSMPALRTVVTDTTLTVMAAINTEQKTFTISGLLDGSVNIPTGGSSDLKIGDASVSFIFNDGVTFQILGDLAMDFDHQRIDVEPRLSINPEEIEFSVGVEFENGWHKPMGIQGLTLDEVDFEMGVNLLPAPGVNLGLEGKAHIGSQQAKSDDFAFVLEVIEEVPNPLLLSFYLAEVDIKTGLQVFTPQVNVSSLPSFINDINLRDVNVYWADSVVVMPDGTVAQPGLRFSGNLEVLGFAAHAAIEIDQVAGMAGEFETSPIHFHNILSITGKGKGVYLNKKNGKTLPVTVKPNKDQAGVEKVEVVPPGGPVFIFHTLQSPYLKMNIKVSFFSLVNEEVEALVADDAVHFKLILGIGHVANADFDFTLTKTGFAAHSIFGLHLKASIGPIKILGIDFGSIHLDTGFDIQVTIVANEDHFSFKIDGDFEFEGARLNFPTITLSFAPKSLADLPAIILKQVEDHADEIFKDLFNAAAELLKEGIKEAEHLAEEAGKEVAKLASEAEKEAEHLVSEAAQAVEHTAEEAAKAVADVEKAAEKVLADAAEEVAEIGKEAAEEVEKIGKDITHVAEAAEHEVEAIGKEVAQEAEEVGKAVAHLASEAVAEVKAIGKAAEKAAESVLNAANKAAASVVNAAKAVAATLAHEATTLWNEAKKLGDAIANAAKKAADAVGHAAKSAWHAVSKY